MKKNVKPQFFAQYKDFNSGKIESFDVLQVIFDSIFNSKGGISKKNFFILDEKWNRVAVRTKEHLKKYLEQEFRYHFWAKCEWEFICIDWPHRDTIKDSRPVKIDVFDQLKPNIPVITDLVWNYIEPKVQKLIDKNE